MILTKAFLDSRLGWIIAILINCVVPVVGLAVYVRLLRGMRLARVPAVPSVSLFLVFATYGGLLLVLLTTLFWRWSGLASVGTAYLCVVAPFVMGGVAIALRDRREASPYHRTTFRAAALYLPVIAVLVGAARLLTP